MKKKLIARCKTFKKLKIDRQHENSEPWEKTRSLLKLTEYVIIEIFQV